MSIAVLGDRLPLKKYSKKLLGKFIKIYYTPGKVRQEIFSHPREKFKTEAAY
jgi:hypothetical protein